MQNAKDTFYELLRGRLKAINPERTIAVRGVVRPGVLVEENELQLESTVALPDCFRLNWTAAHAVIEGALPLVTLTCAIEYETAGTAANAGMDRGRALSAMDGELLAAMNQSPHCSLKTNYAALAGGGSATPMATKIWWGPVDFGKTVTQDDRIGRTATIAVMSYQEAGEL
jgi:hypothetical protein